jgi:hypothetical protein
MRSRLNSFVCGGSALAAVIAVALCAPGTAGATGTAPHACPPQTPVTLNQGPPGSALLSRLAVLRRPATAEDQFPAGPGLSELPYVGEGIYVNYIRHAVNLGGTSYYLVPVQRAIRVSGCPNTEEVMLVAVEPNGFRSWSGVSARQLAEGKDVGTRWLTGHSYVYGLVPDEVSRVTVRYKVSGRRRPVDASARPVNNVFVVAVPATVATSALPVVPRTVLWRSAAGRVIKTVHTGG